MLVSAIEGVAPSINIPSALLTFYLVITGMTTVRATNLWSRRLDIAAMLTGFGIGMACIALGVMAIGVGGPGAGMAYPLFMFAAVALSAGEGDRRMIRAGSLPGAARLPRHLWRMCFALFVASIAFYLGEGRLPEALNTPAFRAFGVLLPIVAMLFWRWRLRRRRSASMNGTLSPAEAA
jgi:hypothetical protein